MMIENCNDKTLANLPLKPNQFICEVDMKTASVSIITHKGNYTDAFLILDNVIAQGSVNLTSKMKEEINNIIKK